MIKRFNLFLMLLFCSFMVFAQQTYGSLKTKGDAAYDNKAYVEATTYYIKAFELGKPDPGDVYNLACCYALIQDQDNAFKYLKMAVDHGFTNTNWMRQDSDLNYLHQFPEWKQTIQYSEKGRITAEKGINSKLKLELINMKKEDQELRRLAIDLMKQPELQDSLNKVWDQVTAIDIRNTKRMKEIVYKYGWPTKSLVGNEGSAAAWLLVQHADLDPKFQAKCLDLMGKHLANNEVSKKNYAYLYDRVKTGQAELQMYGTQAGDNPMTGKTTFLPIKDESNVDARRAEVNITKTAKEYAAQMGFEYELPSKEDAQQQQLERDQFYAEQIKKAKDSYKAGRRPQALESYRAALRIYGSINNEDLLEGAAVAAEFGQEAEDNAFWWLGKLMARGENVANQVEQDQRFEAILQSERWSDLKAMMQTP
ncbi:MAG: DUF6624 domain-containing protein [Bacteroidota bacterium]